MYKVPKNGATVTIYAPYDCGNNCPFCVNKKDSRERASIKPVAPTKPVAPINPVKKRRR